VAPVLPGQGPRLRRFGLSGEADWTAHGAESLYPKLGTLMVDLIPYLENPATMDEIARDGSLDRIGQLLQSYLKIAWQYGKDMRAEPDPEPGRATLVDAYQEAKHPKKSGGLFSTSLNDFVKSLPEGGYLGDAFADKKTRDKYAGPLEAYVKALVDELRERGEHDDIAPTDTSRGPVTPEDKGSDFDNRRNAHFRQAVRDAAARGVRYAGMGEEHSAYLARVGPDSTWHIFDMNSHHIRQFRDLTRQRTQQAGG
jgi:hypothetical protein